MSLESLIARYGLLAIGLGAVIEGETVVATGGLLAHRGLLPLGGVMLAAAIGTCIADQGLFFLGRHHRDSRFVQRVSTAPGFARAMALVERYPTAFILMFRFLWGLRTVSPIALGTTRIAWGRFAALNIMAAIGWAVIVALAGYLLSSGLSRIGAEIRTIEHYALAILAIAVTTFATGWLLRRRLNRG
jgi:membrane protein DedA with SNARE-associated domain